MISTNTVMSEPNRKKLLELDLKWAKIKMASYEKKKEEIDLSEYMDEFMENVKDKNHKPINISIPETKYEKKSDENIDALIDEFKKFKCILSPLYIESLETMKTNSSKAKVKHAPVKEAIKILKEHKWVKKNSDRKKISTDEVYNKCCAAAKLLPNWKVVFSKSTAARMSINGTSIRIMKDATFYEDEIEGLITHEIYTHAYRKFRGMRIGLWLFVLGMKGNSKANEGLAIYNQMKHASPYKNTLKIIALKRVVSYELSKIKSNKKGDIYDVFEKITNEYPDIPRNVVYSTIMRAKRCCSNTDSYKYIDASVYFDGYTEVKELDSKTRTILSEWPISIELAKSPEMSDIIKFLNVNLFPQINKSEP